MKLLFAFTASLLAFWGTRIHPILQNSKSEPMIITDAYIPSGYMGDGGAMSTTQQDNARPDSLCVKVIYTPKNDGWGGIYWQYPANNWCKWPGVDLSGYSKLTFQVRGEQGNEVVKFKFGQDCGDTYAQNPPVTKRLAKTWEKVTINLSGKDLTNITGAFAWIVDAKANQGRTITFYLDDIQCE